MVPALLVHCATKDVWKAKKEATFVKTFEFIQVDVPKDVVHRWHQSWHPGRKMCHEEVIQKENVPWGNGVLFAQGNRVLLCQNCSQYKIVIYYDWKSASVHKSLIPGYVLQHLKKKKKSLAVCVCIFHLNTLPKANQYHQS